MRITETVRTILDKYESDNPGTKSNLARILMEGKLGGTGKLVILPVDQGFEHGPARSFAANPAAYDPHYLFELAIEAGCSAYAAPLGSLEAGANAYAGQVPLILKMNSANSLAPKDEEPSQAITASVDDALRLGCNAIGYTLYPGSAYFYDMLEELRELIREAKSVGIPTVVWSYPRGGDISKDGETAIDVDAYAAHMACLAGAHIVKVKLPTDHLEQAEAKKIYESENVPIGTMAERVAHIVKACYDGRRLVVFSGGGKKGEEGVLDDARAIRDGGGNGSIIGRNSFQRSKQDAVRLLGQIMDIYLAKG